MNGISSSLVNDVGIKASTVEISIDDKSYRMERDKK